MIDEIQLVLDRRQARVDVRWRRGHLRDAAPQRCGLAPGPNGSPDNHGDDKQANQDRVGTDEPPEPPLPEIQHALPLFFVFPVSIAGISPVCHRLVAGREGPRADGR